MEIEKIMKINKIVKELPERDAKLLLSHILKEIHFLNEQVYSEEQFIKDIKRTYEVVFEMSEQRQNKIEGPYMVAHILFGDSAAGCSKGGWFGNQDPRIQLAVINECRFFYSWFIINIYMVNTL